MLSKQLHLPGFEPTHGFTRPAGMLFSPYPAVGVGWMVFCPVCYPMLATLVSDEPVCAGHYRHGYANSLDKSVVEHGVELRNVEEAVALLGVPGLLLREYVVEPDGRFVLCGRHGHAEPMRRIRYSASAFVV